MSIICFSGGDKSGKSTLRSELILALHKKTNFIYPIINDRFTETSWVYGKFHERQLNFDEYLKQDLRLIDDCMLVYLYCDQDILEDRFKKTNETDVDLKDYNKLLQLYETYIDATPLFVVSINTTQPIADCVKEIKLQISQFEKWPMEDKVQKIVNVVQAVGKPQLNAIELTNIKFSFEYLSNRNYSKIIEEELLEYTEILVKLQNSIRLKLEYFKNQTLDSRQFVAVSESCISMFHIMKRDNTLEVNMHLRSCNLRYLKRDCYGAHYIASKLNKDVFHCDKIKFVINIDSAHVI